MQILLRPPWVLFSILGIAVSCRSGARQNLDYSAPEQLLYAFLRRRGANAAEAEDSTREFFRRFLERNALSNVTPMAGKFRSSLLAGLKNFLSHEVEWSRAQRRGAAWLRCRSRWAMPRRGTPCNQPIP